MPISVRDGAVGLLTGEVGSGKSMALRYVLSKLDPSEYRTIWITACSASILEFYRILLAELNREKAGSKAVMVRVIQKAIREIILEKKMKIVLVVDEAGLLRLEVLAELHTITQFEQDSKPWLPIILAGRTNLIDNLMYQTSLPLASRIVSRSHMEPVSRQEMEQYLYHTWLLPASNRHLRGCRHHRHTARLRRDIQEGEPSGKGSAHRSSRQPILNCYRRSCQTRGNRSLLNHQHRAGSPRLGPHNLKNPGGCPK